MKIILTLCAFLPFIANVFATINLNIESSDLCSYITKRKIKLGRSDDSSLVVNQQQLNDHLIDWDKNLNCKFQVTSKQKDGIFAVIQNLNFRKNLTTGDCVDYLQFEKKHHVKSRKFCGKINAQKFMEEPEDSIYAYNTFVETDGEMDVIIFVSSKALSLYEYMDLNIVFTTYRRNCHLSKNDVPCGKYWEACIHRNLIDNSDINCPYYGCVDENNCREKTVIVTTESVGNTVLIASISSLLLVFGMFVCCLWLCKMHRILCWSDDFSARRENSQVENTRIELDENPTNQNICQVQPNAPQQSPEDKDLPPTYDSLFPAR